MQDPNLKDVYFDKVMKYRDAVCRFVARDDFKHPVLEDVTKDSGFGSGILVGFDFILTSNHVIPTEEVAQSVVAVFQGGSINRFEFEKPAIVHSSDYRKQDFSLLRVKSSQDKDRPGKIHEFYELKTSLEHRSQLYPNRLLINIIHYPLGHPQRSFEIRGRTLDYIGENPDCPFVAYDARTYEGSSGAPVFNDFWWLIALHQGKNQADDKEVEFFKEYRKGVRIDVIIDSVLQHCNQDVLKELGLK